MKHLLQGIPAPGPNCVGTVCPPQCRRSGRVCTSRTVAAVLLALTVLPGRVLPADDKAAAVERRLADSARYLASDELEGRGAGTKGLDLAAEYIASQFSQAGLNTDLFDATPFQAFVMTTSAKIGKHNKLAFVGPQQQGGKPQRIELKVGDDFSPISVSGSGRLDLPLVFVGYGITAKEEGYDDYAGIDAAGKAVVALRHEPQQADPQSVFNGTKDSAYAPFRRKVSNAFEHGAAAVVFCTDQFEIRSDVARQRKKWQEALDRLAEQHAKFKQIEKPTLQQIEAERQRIEELTRQVALQGDKLRAEYDPVLPFTAGGGGSGRDFPVIHCRRSVLDRILKAALGTDLATLEQKIDQGPTPHSRPLTGWRITGEVEVERTESEVKNVVAVLEGEGPLSHEVLVIGAHYDHLGWGGPGSLDPKKKEVHNGADDNASGVAVLLEVARALAGQEKPRRSVVFIAFAGEESGLFGSSHYLRYPLFPIDKTIAMLNLDMVGRLRDDKLIVGGSGTSGQFGQLLDEVNGRHGFRLTKNPTGYGPSDHSAFYGKRVPVMHFFTGTHKDYHRPSDDFDKLNVSGMRRISAMVTEIATALVQADDRPQYVAVARPPERAGDRPFFGSIPDFAYPGPGYAISGVTEGGPAERAGLLGGDVVIQFGESKIGNLEDFDSALRKYNGGDRVQVVVLRGGQQQVFEVTLDPPR